LFAGTLLEYKEHNASLRDNSSFRNTNVYRPPGLRGAGGVQGAVLSSAPPPVPGAGTAGIGPIGSGVLQGNCFLAFPFSLFFFALI
jgi:hypothetical protein